jgi:type IV secretion system protein TrbE
MHGVNCPGCGEKDHMILLLILISAAGLLLVAMLYVRLSAVDKTRQLKQYRSGAPGLPDLLNYAALVDDGVMIGKNGVLIAGWEYQGTDQGSVTDVERDVVSARLNQALARLGSGWMLHVDAVRRPANPYSGQPESRFPDPVSAAIEAERRAFFDQLGAAYETKLILCVSYLPPTGAVKKLSEIIYDDDTPPANEADAAKNTLEYFERELATLENRLSSIPFSLRRLRSYKEDGVIFDELLSHLQYCVTGIRHPIRLPRTPVHLDAIIGGQELYAGVLPRIGRQYMQVVAIDGFPADSFSGMLTRIGPTGGKLR